MNVVIVFNVGSSNIKCTVFEYPSLDIVYKDKLKNISEAFDLLKKYDISEIIAIGHRVVHSGGFYDSAILANELAFKKLRSIEHLAPLHQPANLDMIDAISQKMPNVRQILCFDTSFHHSCSDIEKMLPLPDSYAEKGLRRYGFHGISYEYIASILPKYLPREKLAKVVVAHLGNGSSMCALHELKSFATTMGFSTIDGLMMGTRSGSIDPGAILHCQEHLKMSLEQVTELLYHKSGLIGVSGISSDMKILQESEQPNAKIAIQLYVHDAVKHFGSLLALLGGIDALVFTGGIGENASLVRSLICEKLTWLGLRINESANAKNSITISDPSSIIPILVIPTDEELQIAISSRTFVNSG